MTSGPRPTATAVSPAPLSGSAPSLTARRTAVMLRTGSFQARRTEVYVYGPSPPPSPPPPSPLPPPRRCGSPLPSQPQLHGQHRRRHPVQRRRAQLLPPSHCDPTRCRRLQIHVWRQSLEVWRAGWSSERHADPPSRYHDALRSGGPEGLPPGEEGGLAGWGQGRSRRQLYRWWRRRPYCSAAV